MRSKLLFLTLSLVPAAWCATDLVPVVSKPVSRTIDLPGEFLPYLSVAIHARIGGYIETISVDRGSVVKQGQVLAELSAPEIKARIVEARSRVDAAEADRAQAEAQLAAAQSTLEHLKQAAATPGVIAGTEIIQAEKMVDAAKALVQSREQSRRAAQAGVDAEKELEAYLRITAPFDGVVTERFLHPGALAGPPSNPPLLTLQQLSRLRLVVFVPETDIGGITRGASVTFHVPAFPDRAYSGTVARLAHTVENKSRTMAVEVDVMNRDDSLSPGMYPSVKWPVRRAHPALFVPKTSVVTTTERTFVIRNRNGHAEWVDVRKGISDGDLMEITGDLQAGDAVVKRATDEIREGISLVSPQ